MLISDLIGVVAPEKTVIFGGIENVTVTGISCDTRDKSKSTVFFAYKGEAYDSNLDAEEIYKSGLAVFVVAEKYLGNHIPHVVVKDGRKALSMAVSAFFGNPLDYYKSVAVTGTNGKTTTTYILDSIFKNAGGKTVRIGTTGAEAAGKVFPLDNTTPSAYDFFSILAQGRKLGCGYASMEISSHALAQGRLAGAKFGAAIFTNLTGDHIDFHKSMENYFGAKALLFDDAMSRNKVVNISGDYGKRLAEKVKSGLITFSCEKGADIYPIDYSFDVHGVRSKISAFGKEIDISTHLIGEYNLENILGAFGAAYALGISESDIVKGIEALLTVPGRLDRVKSTGYSVFVDYAHTDDALKNVLLTVRKVAKGRVITVFGAGGDRDNTKRPRMGKVASEMSDITIVTSDNPRTENPQKIIDDIMKGVVAGASVKVEPDREKAIALAITSAHPDDVVLIAGKGHEDYQIIGKMKYPFDDKAVAAKYILRTKIC